MYVVHKEGFYIMNKADINKTIPIIVGVTGHIDIRKEDEDKLKQAVKNELDKLQKLCPHSRLVVLTNLAKGADMLCAEVAKELEYPLYIALPMEKETYENAQQFNDIEKESFNYYCESAERIFVTSETEKAPNEETEAVAKKLLEPGSKELLHSLDKAVLKDAKRHLYRQAGIYIVNHCHILLALWHEADPKKAGGCGTADMVSALLKSIYSPISGIPFRSANNEAIIHIHTPRRSEHTGSEKTAAVDYIGNWTVLNKVIERTDIFNASSSQITIGEDKFHLLPKDYKEKDDAVLEHINRIYHIATDLSKTQQTKYRNALKWMARLGTLITFSFLLYDEFEMIWLILACGAALLADYLFLREVSASNCHKYHIEYRVLSEDLRVQAYLRYAGSRLQVADILPWTQQNETVWIMDALCALTAGKQPEERKNSEDVKNSFKGYWINGQRSYHVKKAGEQENHNETQETIAKWTLRLIVGLYIFTLLFEITCGGLLISPVIQISDIDYWRSWLKVFLGTLSAAAFFSANYFGKLSPKRILSDHKKLDAFYERMTELLDNNPGLREEVLTALAREMLIENGNWYSYQKDNTPDIEL